MNVATLCANEFEEDLLHYILKNSVFAHTKADSALMTRLTSTYDNGIKRTLGVLGWKKDGLYVNSNFMMKAVKEMLKYTPNLIKQSVFQVNCDNGNASRKIMLNSSPGALDVNKSATNAMLKCQYWLAFLRLQDIDFCVSR